MRKPQLRMPTILGLALAVAGLAAGLALVRNPIKLFSSAAADETPQQVRITNISDTMFVVSWTTVGTTTGFVRVREQTLGAFERVFSDDRDQQKGTINNYFTHLITVMGLRPKTAYEVRLGSGRTSFEQQVVTTGSIISSLPVADVAYGQVVSTSGDPAEGAIVYAQLPNAITQAAMVRASGSWVVPLATTRRTDLAGYVNYDKKTAPLKIEVVGGKLGQTTVNTLTGHDSPVAVITLTTTQLIDATNVTIDKPAEGENFAGTTIEGLAPKGSNVKISLDSQDATVVTADQTGKFNLDIAGLAFGKHNVTVVVTSGGRAYVVMRSFSRSP